MRRIQSNAGAANAEHVSYKRSSCTLPTHPPHPLISVTACFSYPDSSTHWMIRKKFAVQWALYAAVQLATGMTSLNLREMHLDLASSQLFCTAHSFGLEVGSSGNIQLSNSPQYRLTPNLAEYMQVDIEEDGTVHLPGTNSVVDIIYFN